MKRIRIVLILTMLLSFLVIGINLNKKVNASGLVIMKDHKGNNMTYKGSSEPVYQLAEYNYPTSQLRATWVSMYVGDLPSYTSESKFKSDATAMLDDIEKMGMNAIVYHVRTHNNAMYKSELNPLASWYSGVNFDIFDPTAWLIDECHKRGIEFHAWLNPYRISTNGSTSSNISGSIPDVNPVNDSNNLLKAENNVILDPGIPSNREFIIDTCMEIVENYDVDAIHFDDYFYIKGADDTLTRQKYNTENLSTADFRRKQVDLFIEGLSKELRAYNKTNNKTIQLGISPSGVYRNGGYVSKPTYDENGNLSAPLYSNTAGSAHYDDYLYSDTLNWINNEWIDYIMPQCYWAVEHNEARYTELARWWSWAVRNKNVNLYTGLGIYMAAQNSSSGSYGYWQLNDDEIEKQLLYAGQFDEFGGACFYQYKSLKETNITLIKNAVDLISNDYWAKRVPGVVQKYYAPLTDEITPTGVVFDSANNTIKYDALSNVRGYMIYQVSKGENLDKNNINHVYEYTQATSIKVNNTDSYDYYVASVNLANEVSDVVKVNINLNASDVINAINNLPTTITYENKTEVENVRKLYESLSETEQAKVTNLNILVNAENVIASYNTYLTKLDNYINSLDLHIKTNRVIPTSENITLSYKNASDENIYNLSTGEKLKSYLDVKNITLIATLNENGVSVSKEFNINVGYLSTNQTGLFYRNDPSSMSPVDEGAYVEGGTGYIGWSGHTVVIDNYVLFIANSNYYEITDSTNIEKCNWSSVAGVYINKTTSNITMKMTNAFDNISSNSDGFFIISDNKIKSIYSGWDTTAIITLAKDEAVVIVRYLDSQIEGNIMCPVSTLTIGQKAYIDYEKVKTPQEYADEMISLINTIPTTITLNDELLINSINSKFNELSDDAKALVSNKDILTNAINTINTLKKELSDYKTNKINELNNYVDETLYSKENQKQIELYLLSAKITINGATSQSKIDEKVTSTKKQIDDLLTISEELEVKKVEAINGIQSYVILSAYSSTNQQIVQNIIIETIANINNATTLDELTTILCSGKINIDMVDTLLDEENALQELRNKYIVKINNLLDSFVNVTSLEKIELTKIADNFKNQIQEAYKESDINYLWTRAEATMNEYLSNLDAARQKVISRINEYIAKLTYVEKELINVNKVAEEKKAYIYEIASIEQISKVVDEFINIITTTHNDLEQYKSDTILKLNDLIKLWYTDSQKSYISELISDGAKNIQLSGSTNEVLTIYNDTTNDVNIYIQSIEKAISDAITYVNSKQDKTNEEIISLINRIKITINNSKTVEEVEELLREFDKQYDLIINKDNNENTDTLLEETIKAFRDTVLKTNTNTDKARDLKTETLKALENAKTLDEANNIMNNFNLKINDYNKKSCSNNTYMYLGTLLSLIGLLFVFRKKH